MNGWWWIPIGLIAWLAVAVTVALWLGSVLRSCSQAREDLDRDISPTLTVLRHWPQASYPGEPPSQTKARA